MNAKTCDYPRTLRDFGLVHYTMEKEETSDQQNMEIVQALLIQAPYLSHPELPIEEVPSYSSLTKIVYQEMH